MENNFILYSIYLLYAFGVVTYCTVKLVRAMKEINKNNLLIQFFVFMLFYLFYVLPIVTNILYPDYHYESFYQADDAMRDYFSNLIYLLFVHIFSYLIINSARKDNKIEKKGLVVNPGLVNICTIVIILCFIITLIVSGIQSLLGGYGYAYINQDINVNEGVIGCGIMSYLVVLGHAKIVSKLRIFLLTIIVLCFFWIVGKRYIIAETLIMSLCVLGLTGNMSGKRMMKSLVLSGILIVALGFIYGVFFKENVSSFLDYINVDFSRQYTLVYQFYCEKIGRHISPNPFDGILFVLTFFIPRFVWPDKPYPFVNYLTLSLCGQEEVDFVNAGWATTCSIFSDLFDSFSYFGIILGFIVFIKLFHKINIENRIHYKVIFVYIAVRLLTVQISSAIVQISIILILLFIAEIFTKKVRLKDILITKKLHQ